MDKEKVLIVSHGMEIGGVEKALLGMLENIDYSNTEVDLFLFRHDGIWMKYIPEAVNLLPPKAPYDGLAVPMKDLIKKPRYWELVFRRLYAKSLAHRFIMQNNSSTENDIGLVYSHYYTQSCMPMISDKEYDVAISYLTPHYFVLNKVKAAKKIAWIHTDYSVMDVDNELENPMWERFDSIVSISEDCSKSFLKKFPDLEEKLILIENMLPKKLILKQASICDDPYASYINLKQDSGKIIFLSIGRYCYQKNFDSIPEISSYLVELGLDFKWFLIGYGPDEQKIVDKINIHKMKDCVVLLGQKDNPYPFIRHCDWYIQPSRYEGRSVAVQEAQLLGKPVIITDYPTAKSQIDNGLTGIIVPMESLDCAKIIYESVNDNQLKLRLEQNLTGIDDN